MKPISIKVLLLSTLLMLCINTQAGVEITYIHNDALGSPVAGTDEQGAVRWRSYYQPYGEETLGERQLQAESTGFTGHREDADTGLVYMGARFYSPTLGRFMGIDPAGVNLGDIHSFNRYAYANNNPYKYVDPDGRSPKVFELTLRGGFAVGNTLNTIAFHVTGVTISTMLVDTVWNAVHNENSGGSDNSRSTDDAVDLEEDLAGKEILGDFENGGGVDISDKMGEPRFGPKGTHDKLRGSHQHGDGTVTEVHADRSRKTGELSNKKFKTGTDNRKSR